MLQAMRGPSDVIFGVQPRPDSGMALFHVMPSIAEPAKKVVSYATQTTGSLNLMQAMQLDWNQRVQPVSDTSGHGCLALSGGAGGGAEAVDDMSCRVHGVCLCYEGGNKVKKMSNAFLRAFKPSVKYGSSGRADLNMWQACVETLLCINARPLPERRWRRLCGHRCISGCRG